MLTALRQPPRPSPFKKGDVLVLFGELFSRGYANGLVDEAERVGMKVVRATVGRRDKDGQLRPLTAEESAAHPQPFINVPLEAGFDLEPSSKGIAPVDFLKDVKLSDWENVAIDWASVEDSRQRGVERFRQNTQKFMKELDAHVPPGANVLFAHLMAGGVPRTKLVMPILNRVVKGTGERHLPSEKMWTSEIGKLCEKSFLEVTAETFHHMIDLSSPLRKKIENAGGRVSYLAYGYHGTEILLGGTYQWQTYTPYVQGWAKMRLEDISKEARRQGLRSCVYNCPEILTNSSSIFQGVEVSLYPLVFSLEKEASQSAATKKVRSDCAALLKEDEAGLAQVKAITDTYFGDPEIKRHCVFEKWPQHTTPQQLETMLKASEDLYALHKDSKNLMTAVLSEAVFEACGRLMLHGTWEPEFPAAWIGHDVVAKTLTQT